MLPMKNIYYLFLACATITCLFSCEKELQKYEGKPTVYFNETARPLAYSSEVLKDSTVISFSLTKGTTVDSLVHMVIATIGGAVDYDRPYKIVSNSSSTAIESKHYELITKDFSIKKNQLRDTIWLRFLRTPDMKDQTFLLSFDLLENENFSVDMQFKTTNQTTGQKLNFINYRWFINDITKRPARWLDFYLGTFSRTKLNLMVEILNVDPQYMDTNISIAETLAYGKFMQRYLNEQKAAGNLILDEDGQPMNMGSATQ
ncbi:hypothetical protein AAW12_16255 [Sphingobacterium sp. Ag1]|nr:hypothetical protein AAW12_16255 [Sphingobacterium sp. Ag1]